MGDLRSVALDELRARRGRAQEEETMLSYVRRLAQGRIDIVSAEVGRRGRGEPEGSVVDHLPEILGHDQRSSAGRVSTLEPPDLDDPALTADLDGIAPPGRMVELPSLDDGALGSLLDALVAYEQRVSARRHELHLEIDDLQEEIVRRYKTGEASVDSLLT